MSTLSLGDLSSFVMEHRAEWCCNQHLFEDGSMVADGPEIADRILAMAAEMAGDEARAKIWFEHQPIPGWAGQTASDLIREGKSAKVLDYLAAVQSGSYA